MRRMCQLAKMFLRITIAQPSNETVSFLLPSLRKHETFETNRREGSDRANYVILLQDSRYLPDNSNRAFL